MSAPLAVSASFSRPKGNGGNSGNSGTFKPRSLGLPIVVRTAVGWAVTLRFFTNRGVSALLRMSLNGRLVTAFQFSPHSGTSRSGRSTSGATASTASS